MFSYSKSLTINNLYFSLRSNLTAEPWQSCDFEVDSG
jgi:hypothetical protein